MQRRAPLSWRIWAILMNSETPPCVRPSACPGTTPAAELHTTKVLPQSHHATVSMCLVSPLWFCRLLMKHRTTPPPPPPPPPPPKKKNIKKMKPIFRIIIIIIIFIKLFLFCLVCYIYIDIFRYFLLVFWHNSHDIFTPNSYYLHAKQKERKKINSHSSKKQTNKKHNLNCNQW